MSETWKDIEGYEGMYQVSDAGRVRSLDRVVPDGKGSVKNMKGIVLRPAPNLGGYLQVVLSKESKTKTHAVHSLVSEAFRGTCPKGKEVLHGLKGQQCNYLTNLRYGTSKENSKDMIDAGRSLARAVVRSDGKRYHSLMSAAQATNCFDSEICNVCKGRLKTAGGFGWKYEI